MNILSLISLAVIPSTGSLLGLLRWVAIAAIVIWAIYALLQWAGVSIPPPVRIIFIALVCIFLIIFLFRVFGIAVS